MAERGTRGELATAQISDAFPPILDGVAVTVVNYARWLPRTLGPTVVVTPGPRRRRGDDAGVDVIRYLSLPVLPRPPYRFGLPALDPTLGPRLARRPVDLVHCHSPFSAIRVARTLTRRRRAPLVATFHSKYRDDLSRAVPFRALVDGRIRKIVRFFESADEVWIPSESAIDTLRSYGYRGEVQVVPHGIDIEPPDDPGAARRLADRVLGTRPDDRVLLYVGQIVWEKDLEVLVRALAELAARGTGFSAVLIGGGYARDEVAALGAELGLGERLRLVGEVRDREALRACYARAELFVFPSRYDTSGLVVREAAGVGLPAVLARGADTAEGVRDGDNGFLADPDAGSFAAAIERALTDPDLVRRVGGRAMRTLCQPWREAVEAVADRYREVVAAHHPDRSRPISLASASTSDRSSSATE